MIPKIAFTYWEGDNFSFFNFLTVETFAKLNPDFQVIVYRPMYPTTADRVTWKTGEQSVVVPKTADIELLKLNKNVRFVEVDFKQLINSDKQFSPVHRGDIIRIYKLYEHGGIWFDFDILFLKRIPEELLMNDDKWGVFTYCNIIAAGFVIADKYHPVTGYILRNIQEMINSSKPITDYQQFSPLLFTCLIRNKPLIESHVKYFDNEIVYPYLWNQVNDLFYSNNNTITEKTVGIHWYNGSNVTREYIQQFDKTSIDPMLNVFNMYACDMIKKLGITI